MTLITAEISAAPHLPWGLRTDTGSASAGNGDARSAGLNELREQNGELFIVSHAATAE